MDSLLMMDDEALVYSICDVFRHGASIGRAFHWPARVVPTEPSMSDLTVGTSVHTLHLGMYKHLWLPGIDHRRDDNHCLQVGPTTPVACACRA